MKNFQRLSLINLVVLSLIGTCFGQIVHWTDWESATVSNYGSASGTITLPDSSTVTVSYIGDVFFANTDGGTNYWNYPGTYSNEFVENLPPSSDIIAIDGKGYRTHSLTFSKPLTDPIFAIVSMGRIFSAIQYHFDAPFDVISVGPGSFGEGNLTQLPGNVLEGNEGNGMIQFKGTFDSIAWSCPIDENWHGFTVAAIPEPSTLLILTFGTALALYKKRNRQG